MDLGPAASSQVQVIPIARCGCTNTCTCSVVAGTGTTVTGTGSAADPYVINASGASVQANDTNTVNHTLTGTGTGADPYILTSQVIVDPVAGNTLVAGPAGLSVPCEAIQDCVGQGFEQGLIYDDAANAFRARIDPVAGNTITQGPAGLLVPAGAAATVTTADTPCIAVNGDGSPGLPVTAVLIISPAAGNNITCTPTGLFVPTGAATVTTADTPCIAVNGDGSGATPITAVPIIDPAAGNMLSCEAGGLRADLSVAATPCITLAGTGTPATPLTAAPVIDPNPANTLTCGPAGLLATGSPVVTALCGLEGNGTAATPLAVNVAAWPFACDQNTNAQGVYCNPVTGELQSPPAAATDCDQINVNTNVAATAIPAAPLNISSETLNYTNPSTCRPAVVLIEAEADVDINIAVGSVVSMYQAGDEMYQMENTGSSVMSNVHTQTTKVACFALAPGASGSFTQNIEVEESVGGGSTYTRVQSIIRAFIFSV